MEIESGKVSTWELKRCSISKTSRSIPRFDSACFFPYPHNTVRDLETLSPAEHDFLFNINGKYHWPEKYHPCMSIVKGERLGVDVTKLLSNPASGRDYLVRNNGDRVPVSDAISGNYLLIRCFHLPMLISDAITEKCLATIKAYTELKKRNKNFEMVVVAKMRSEYVAEYDEYAEQEAAFNHFFSAFPCLAIPFSDEDSRHAIFKLIGLSDLILDPEQNVLQTYAQCIHKYGVAAFPFTQNHLLDLDRKDKELKMRLDPIYKVTGYRAFPRYPVYDPEDPLVNKPLPLEELLCCKPNTVLERLGGSGEKVTVSELSKKRCVLLYLCYNGEFMYSLDRICNKYGNKYEIVFISAPINSEESSHSKAVQLVLSEKNISSSSSWWQLTLADEDMRRLFRIGRVTANLSDALITWADGGTNGELNAIPLIRRFGYDIYPCTRKQLLDERLTWLRSLTLESFLGQNARLCSSDNLQASNLKNRDILLYFNLWDHLGVEELDELREYYALFKKDNPAAEMIFVPMDAKPLDDARRVPCPRLSHPPEPSHPTVVKLFKIGILDSSCVVALGADKQIKKVFFVDSLSKKRVRVSLFEDTLLEDVRRDVFERLDY